MKDLYAGNADHFELVLLRQDVRVDEIRIGSCMDEGEVGDRNPAFRCGHHLGIQYFY